MKEIEVNQMAIVIAGKKGCGLSLIGLGLTLVGTFSSFATLNPLGIILGVGGIYTGFTSVIESCGEPVIQ